MGFKQLFSQVNPYFIKTKVEIPLYFKYYGHEKVFYLRYKSFPKLWVSRCSHARMDLIKHTMISTTIYLWSRIRRKNGTNSFLYFLYVYKLVHSAAFFSLLLWVSYTICITRKYVIIIWWFL